MHVVFVQRVGQGLGVRIMILVKAQCIPAVFAPPLPVLDDNIQRNAAALESVGVLKDLVLGAVTLAAVNVSEHPLRHLRNLACQLAVRSYAFVCISCKDGEVNCAGDRGVEAGLVLYFSPMEGWLVAPYALDFQLVNSLFQLNYCRCCRRKPGIGIVNDRIAVNCQILFSGHSLSHIQKQGVCPVFRDFYSLFKYCVETHLPSVALCACGIYRRSAGGGLDRIQFHAVCHRVEICQAVVIPEQSVSLA